MEEIDTHFIEFLGNVVLVMNRERETIKFVGQGNKEFVTMESTNSRGGVRFKKNVGLKDVCHEVVDAYVNGYTIGLNNLLRRGIYTALEVARGKSDENVKDGEEY